MSLLPPELLLTAFLLGAVAGLFVAHLIEAWAARRVAREKRRVRDAATDALLRRGMRALTESEVEELLRPRVRPIRPVEFQVVERAGVPLRFEP